MPIAVIDNYDSFTYNLVQQLGSLGAAPVVFRNDSVSERDLQELAPSHILISPGPGGPEDAGISRQLILRFAGEIPLLGVCLGHQCLGSVFGGKVVEARRLMHGKTSPIHHDGRGVFRGLPNPFTAMRYHSLILDRATLPDDFEISAETDRGELMGIRHRRAPFLSGIQFHPESYLSEAGDLLIANFLAFGTTS